jgi:predicted nucleic acid-binding protein
MGTVTIPDKGLLYLDASVVIYSVETHSTYWPLLKPLWEKANLGEVSLVSSDLTILECLVRPLKTRDQIILTAYEELFESADWRLLPLMRPILREAAQLRADIPALRTPDAIHAATALFSGCTAFLTNDVGFQRITSLPTIILNDVVGP